MIQYLNLKIRKNGWTMGEVFDNTCLSSHLPLHLSRKTRPDFSAGPGAIEIKAEGGEESWQWKLLPRIKCPVGFGRPAARGVA